jgi:hypothetical protein
MFDTTDSTDTVDKLLELSTPINTAQAKEVSQALLQIHQHSERKKVLILLIQQNSAQLTNMRDSALPLLEKQTATTVSRHREVGAEVAIALSEEKVRL